MPRPPVIIIGAHRSGTSMITKLLGQLGLFVGAKLDENHEALFFSELNTWLLSVCGGRWDIPRCIEYVLAQPEGVVLVTDYLRQRLSSFPCIEYLGLERFVRYRSLFNVGEPWGWKDPRSTITLPFWLRLFPDARIVHVIRNGVDVANSLYRRERNGFQEAKRRYTKYKFAIPFREKRGWFGESPRVMDLSEGFRLWEEYVEYGERVTQPLCDQVLTLRYEDFLAAPETNLVNISEFCGLDMDKDRIKQACSMVRRERAFAFGNDQKLVGFWESVHESKWMLKYGYSGYPSETPPVASARTE